MAAAPISDDAIDLDGADHRNSVQQRLRANSSIMQLKKILGMPSLLTVARCLRLLPPYLCPS